MGSGTKRKPNDKVIINVPKTRVSTGSGGGSGGRASEALTCPPSFRVKLPTSTNLKDETPLTLQQEGDIISIFSNQRKVTTLSKNRSTEISACIQAGFKYAGLVKVEKNDIFGEFKRNP
jgi:hypothetical protein